MATPSGTLMSTRLVFSKSKGLRQKPAPTVPVMEQKKKSIDRSVSELDSLLAGDGLDDESIGVNNNNNNDNNNNSATEPKEALPENQLPSDVEKLFALMDNEVAAAGDESTRFDDDDDDGSGKSLRFLQEDRFHRRQRGEEAYASCPENDPDSIAFIDDDQADSSNERELMRSAHTHWTQQSSLSLATSRSAPDVSKLQKTKKDRRRRKRRRHKRRGKSLERKISATIIEKAAHDRSLFVPKDEMTSDKSIDEILLDLATLPNSGNNNPYAKEEDSRQANNGPPIPSLSDLYSRSVLDDDDDEEEDDDEALENAPTTEAVAPVPVQQVASTEAVAAMDQVRPLCALDLEPDNNNNNNNKSIGDNNNVDDKEQHLLEEIMHSIQTSQSAGSVAADLSAVVSNSSMTFSSQEPMSSFSTAGPSVASQSVGDLFDCISGSTVEEEQDEAPLQPTPTPDVVDATEATSSESDAFAGIDLMVVAAAGTGSWVDFGSMPATKSSSTDPVALPENGTLSFPSLRAASDFPDQDEDDERAVVPGVDPAESGPLSGEEEFRVVEEPQDAAVYFQVDPYNSILADDDEDDEEAYDDLAAATKQNHDDEEDDDTWTAFGEDNPFLDRITVTSFSTAPSQTSAMPKDAKQPDSPTSVVISTAGTTGRETPDNWEAFEGTRFEI